MEFVFFFQKQKKKERRKRTYSKAYTNPIIYHLLFYFLYTSKYLYKQKKTVPRKGTGSKAFDNESCNSCIITKLKFPFPWDPRGRERNCPSTQTARPGPTGPNYMHLSFPPLSQRSTRNADEKVACVYGHALAGSMSSSVTRANRVWGGGKGRGVKANAKRKGNVGRKEEKWMMHADRCLKTASCGWESCQSSDFVREGGEREREIGWESIRPCYRPKLFYDRNSLLVNYFMIGDTFGEMKEMIDDVCLIKFNLESIFFLNLIFEFYF